MASGDVDGIPDKTILQLSEDIPQGKELEALGEALGFGPAKIDNFKRTNILHGMTADSTGTVKMLQTWKLSQKRKDQRPGLIKALVKAELGYLADEYFGSGQADTGPTGTGEDEYDASGSVRRRADARAAGTGDDGNDAPGSARSPGVEPGFKFHVGEERKDESGIRRNFLSLRASGIGWTIASFFVFGIFGIFLSIVAYMLSK